MKSSPLCCEAGSLRLQQSGVNFALRQRFVGWTRQRQSAVRNGERRGGRRFRCGACWRLAAQAGRGLAPTGDWIDPIGKAGVTVACRCARATAASLLRWSDFFRDRFEGSPLKRIALSHNATSVRGEAVITRDGIEGGAVYALSAQLRDAIERRARHMSAIDLLPDISVPDLAKRLGAPRGKQSLSTFLRKAANALAGGHRAGPGGRGENGRRDAAR